MNPSRLEQAFMIWFRSANSHTGPQLRHSVRGRTDGSIRLRADRFGIEGIDYIGATEVNGKNASQTEKSSATIPVSKKPDAVTKLIQSNAGKVPSERQYSPCAGWTFVLRQDWKDLGNAAGPACPG
jgi:hypothetical protein